MSESKVVIFPGMTTVPDTPENILEKAKDWGMRECLVIGFDQEDNLTIGGSTCDTRDLVFLLTRAMWFFQANEFARRV